MWGEIGFSGGNGGFLFRIFEGSLLILAFPSVSFVNKLVEKRKKYEKPIKFLAVIPLLGRSHFT